MNGIYSDFESGMTRNTQEGMKPDPVITERKGGYFVTFSPHKSVTEHVAEFASRAKVLVPSLVTYEEGILHTTISDFKVAANFLPHMDENHDLVLQKFCRVITVAQNLGYRAGCNYEKGFVFNQTTGILRGTPTDEFLTYSEAIVAEARKEGIELRLPWGSHVSFARASESVTAQDAKKLAELCKTDPVDQKNFFRFVSLNAGFFWVSEGKFNVEYAISCPFIYD